MTKEEFNKLWKDSTKEEIVNQYYYDYKELQRTNNIINEIEKYAGLGEVNWEDKYQDIMLSSKGLLKRIKELKGNNSNE